MTAAVPSRIGHPAPVIQHLNFGLSAYLQAVIAAPSAAEPGFPWHADLGAFDGPAPNQAAVMAEAARRLCAMVSGIERWQRHPFARKAPDRPVLWRSGASKLTDHGAADAPVILVVPSLINRPYILDLLPQRSFLDRLAGAGFRPLLLDWGTPGAAERQFDMEDYMRRRLNPALGVARSANGNRPPALLGYCMGGTLAAAAVRNGADVNALITIGAPWDFSAAVGNIGAVRAAAAQYGAARVRQQIRTMGQLLGAVPVLVFQHLFAMIDPMQAVRKFRGFAGMATDSAAAQLFVALEDWLADGVPMAAPAAETLLVDWHIRNRIAAAPWPKRPLPRALVVAGTRDIIAQPQVAGALALSYPGARTLAPPLGHVGMITGSRAGRDVLRPVAEFLHQAARRTAGR